MRFKQFFVVFTIFFLGFIIVISSWETVLATAGTWIQTDWVGGSGQTAWNDATQYSTGSSVDHSTAGQVSLSLTANWYNSSWKYRKKITFDNSTQPENLANFPLLVKLDSGSDIDYSKTKDSGEDIRFTDSDGTTLLSYEIETWNESGSSYVWVKVPQVDASSSTDHIYLYYGNAAAADAQTASSVWSDNFSAVWHMKEDPSSASPQIKDSTSNALNGSTGGSMTNGDQIGGKIGGSLDFDGSDDYVIMSDNPLLRIEPPFTLTTWIKIPSLPLGDQEIIGKYLAPNRDFIWAIGTGGTWAFAGGAGYFPTSATLDANDPGVWRSLVISIDASGAYTLFKDQAVANTGSITPTGWQHTTTAFNIARRGNGSEYFLGAIDELTISTVARSNNWIVANYKSQNDTFNTFASEEEIYASSGTLASSIFDTTKSSTWGTLDFVSSGTGTTTVKVRTGNNSDLSDATAFSSCSIITSGSDISGNSCVNDNDRYIQYQSILDISASSTPVFESLSISYATNPDISSVTSIPADNGATITWTTNEIASSQIDYDLTSSYGTTTSVTDTSPRVTSHSVSLTGLQSCTEYHYRVRSTGAFSNETIGTDNSFITTGCVGSATVESQAASSITIASGGQTSLLESGVGVTLNVPTGFSSTDLEFQVKKLDTSEVIASISSPVGYQVADGSTFDFKALSDINTLVSTFDEPIAISLVYTDAQISGLVESSLKLYRWTGTIWEALTTTVDPVTNTATASTSSFSVYSLFGQAVSSSGSSSSGSSSSGSGQPDTNCRDQAPSGKAPALYAALSESSNSIRIYFTDADGPLDAYVLEFGTESGNYKYGSLNIGGPGTRTFLVDHLQPNTKYYFRVKAANGCVSGSWSNEIMGSTYSEYDTNRVVFTDVKLVPKELVRKNKADYEGGLEESEMDEAEVYEAKDKLEQSDDSEGIPAGKRVKLKIIDGARNPVVGADITMHSSPKYGTTNKQGVVTFEDVEAGQHRLLIAYDGFEGEEKFFVPEDDAKEYNLEITVELSNFPNKKLIYMVIAGLVVFNLALLAVLFYLKTTRHSR